MLSTTGRRARSPGWHRRLRTARSKARKLIKRSKGVTHLPQAISERLVKARKLLRDHQRRSRWQPMGGWSDQGKGKQKPRWNQWQQQTPQGGPKKKADKNKKQEKTEQGKNAGDLFPAYESLQASSSSSSAKDNSSNEVATLKRAMRQFLEERSILIDQQMSELLQTGDPMEDVKQEQKVLNLKKKLLSKMDKLRAKHQEKQEAWNKFLDLLEEHRKKEKAKHLEDLRVLNEAMAETQKEINQIVLKESTIDGDTGMLLRMQLAKSNAIIQNLQRRVDSYVSAIPKDSHAFNENSPQMIKEPSMNLLGEGRDAAAAAARAARAQLIQRANASLADEAVPIRSRSTSSSPRRDASNSLERLDR